MATKRVVLYARLSIATDESVSIERQLEAGRLLCKARGWQVIAEHTDDGVSATANRPEDRAGWQQVLAHPEGSFDAVLVWKVDRLARRVLDFLTANEALVALGAGIVAVEDPVDMTTAQGRAFATMLAVFAELEAEGIRARVKAARAALIKAGRVAGGAAPFGYYNADNPDGPGKVVAKDPATIGYLTEAVAMVLRGESIGKVGAYLDDVAPLKGRKNSAAAWTTTVTKRMLSNPILAGMTLHNPGNSGKERGKEVLRDSDGLPIIREDLAVMTSAEFRQLVDALNTAQPRRAASESYLAGLVWCGECNVKMHRNAKNVRGKHIRFFICPSCNQQVSHLETIVQERFLGTYGSLLFKQWEIVPAQNNLAEINASIAETMERMQDDDADVMALAERLSALKAARKQEPETTYTETTSTKTNATVWGEDPRKALTGQFVGVRLVKGRVGRKFDQDRLTFIDLPRFEGDLAEVLASSVGANC